MERFLDAFENHIRERNINIYRVSVVHGTEAPVTREFVPCNPCQNSYSCAKMFTLTALGMLWDEGRLNLEEKLVDILAPLLPEKVAPGWEEITVDMAIRHHMGLPGGYLDIDCKDAKEFGEDFLANVFSYPIGKPDRYIYTDAAYYVLARVVSCRAGMNITDYLWKKLFYPLSFREAAWSSCPGGFAMGATGLYIRTEDMVKLGALYLNDGLWENARLISHDWISTVHTRGYLQKVGEHGAYGHGGMRGQMILVIPEANTAVAWHGFTGENPRQWVADWFHQE